MLSPGRSETLQSAFHLAPITPFDWSTISYCNFIGRRRPTRVQMGQKAGLFGFHLAPTCWSPQCQVVPLVVPVIPLVVPVAPSGAAVAPSGAAVAPSGARAQRQPWTRVPALHQPRAPSATPAMRLQSPTPLPYMPATQTFPPSNRIAYALSVFHPRTSVFRPCGPLTARKSAGALNFCKIYFPPMGLPPR